MFIILFASLLSMGSDAEEVLLHYRDKVRTSTADLSLMQKDDGVLKCLFRSIYYSDEIENIAFAFKVDRLQNAITLDYRNNKKKYEMKNGEYRFNNTILRISPRNTLYIEDSYSDEEEDMALTYLDFFCRQNINSPLDENLCFLKKGEVTGRPYLRGYYFCQFN